jgi:hypothetical protein
VVEALAPYTLAPAWEAWEPFMAKHGYRYALFDSLNRYYLADEAAELRPFFASAPASFDVFQFRDVKPALEDHTHPDHRLAALVAGAAMTRLPLVDRGVLFELLTGDIPLELLEKPAGADDIARAVERLFGPDATLTAADLTLPPAPCLREIYAALIDSDHFRAACGRISASYAW